MLTVAVVIPCHNEEETLLATCRSLGFGDRARPTPDQAVLVLVDNASDDATREVAEAVRRASPSGTVVVGAESERGYVPARRRGNTLVGALAEERGLPFDDVLILQADADTVYSGGYVDAMREGSAAGGGGAMIEGLAEFPPGFRSSYPGYARLMSDIDTDLFERAVPSGLPDLIVDDKACGYRLGAYTDWGGHAPEFTAAGEEVYAETTRLYLRGVSRGATKLRTERAVAYPSQRRPIAAPARELACGGFPRVRSWQAAWDAGYTGPSTSEGLSASLELSEVGRAVLARKNHVLGLFALLPIHVSRSLGSAPLPGVPGWLASALTRLPQRSRHELETSPALFLNDVFVEVDAGFADQV